MPWVRACTGICLEVLARARVLTDQQTKQITIHVSGTSQAFHNGIHTSTAPCTYDVECMATGMHKKARGMCQRTSGRSSTVYTGFTSMPCSGSQAYSKGVGADRTNFQSSVPETHGHSMSMQTQIGKEVRAHCVCVCACVCAQCKVVQCSGHASKRRVGHG